MKKIISILLALVMAMSVTTFAWADGATLEVGMDKTYKTVQAAIDAASAGDTIQIDAGEYEPFIITKQLTIVGTKEGNENKTIIKTMYEESPTWSTGGIGCNSGGVLIYVSGGTVTLRDLNIVGMGVNKSGWFAAPVCNSPTNDGRLPDMIVVDGCNVTYGGAADGAKGIGLMLCGSGMKMTNCVIDGFDIGWATMNDNLKAGTVEMTGNTIRAKTQPIAAYWGVPASENDGNITIRENTFVGTGDDAALIVIQDYAVSKGENGGALKNLTIKNNTVSNADVTIVDIGEKDNKIENPIVEDSVYSAGTFNYDPADKNDIDEAKSIGTIGTDVDKLYHVGDSISGAAKNTGTISVVRAGTEPIIVPEGTDVTNGTGGKIVVNGLEMAAGETVENIPAYQPVIPDPVNPTPDPTPVEPERPAHSGRRYPAATTTTAEVPAKGNDVTSAKTFDGGVMLYAGMALTSAVGMAWMGKKRGR